MFIVDASRYFRSVDQVSPPSLVGAKILARRLQAGVGASTSPNKPNWDSAKLWPVQKGSDELCDGNYKLRAVRHRKDELELVLGQNEARELRGSLLTVKDVASKETNEESHRCARNPEEKGKASSGGGAGEN